MNTRSLFLAATTAIALAMAANTNLHAQEAEASPPAAAPSQPPDDAEQPAVPKEMTFIELYKTAGWAIHFNLLGSIAFVGLTIYNLIALRPARLIGKATLPQIEQAIDELDFQRVVTVAESRPCMLNNILVGGFARVQDEVSPSSIESGMEEAATEEVQRSMVTINYLSTIGVIAPMIGLLGTVSGMIGSFRAMSLGGMGRPELLAAHISEALINTGAGLVVGIPAMVAYFYFKYQFSGTVATVSRISGELLDRTRRALRRYHRGQQGPEVVQAA